MKPLVLITNDDGYFSPGIRALTQAASAYWRVVVVAPDQNRSAIGRSLSLEMPIRVREIGDWRFVISGTPVDCVCYGLGSLLKAAKPSLILSGVNIGANLGTDVLSSGTVAAAIEGYLRGIPSIAISQEERGDYGAAADLAVSLGRKVIAAGQPVLLNVNVPRDIFTDVRLTRLGTRVYDHSVAEKKDPRGKAYFWVGGETIGMEEGKGTDCQALMDGFASVTPLKLDLTDYAGLSSWLIDLKTGIP